MDSAVREADCEAVAARRHDRRRASVRIRSVCPTDAPLLDALIRGLSLGSRQRRFHVGIQAVGAVWLERMTHPDPTREHALVAVATLDGREVCVAEARSVVSDDVAEGREFALVVADGWQGRGIGKTLLLSLGCHAARHGVERLVGDVLRDNLAMIGLARGLGYALRRHPADPRLVRVERPFVALPPALRPPLSLAGQNFI